ncbi:MAG: hypothetical protein HZY79_12415 [Rhodoblastus sp.]|nr:MAG: hypothetical protein HZY79_12415 [Rhodoblastus sp.]
MAAMTPEDFAARFAARAKSQRSIDFLMMKLGRKFLGPDADLRILGPYADLLDTDLLEHASSRWKVTF